MSVELGGVLMGAGIVCGMFAYAILVGKMLKRKGENDGVE